MERIVENFLEVGNKKISLHIWTQEGDVSNGIKNIKVWKIMGNIEKSKGENGEIKNIKEGR